MTDERFIAIIQAHMEGKDIEFVHREVLRYERTPSWSKVAKDEQWNFSDFVYRVAPEPRKPREWRVYVASDGLISSDVLQQPNAIRVREVIE